jgi:short-subunit dehydrogenase
MSRSARKVACAIGGATALALLGPALTRSRRKQLAGKVVLITGGSRGFGLALAREFASLKCRLALCARDRDELERAERVLAPADCEVFTVICDVSDRNAILSAVDIVTRHYGHIDVLVNNAGEIMVSPLENLTIPDFERAMAVMFWGTLYATLAVLPSMKARGQGRIVNVTSIGGKVSVPHLLSYSCAKAAAVAFSNGLRNEIRQFGIEVTTIIPGLMRTGSHVNALFKGNRTAEAAWFGTAASLPLLSISAERAARLAVNSICAGKSEKVLGLPAQILSRAQTLLPALMAEVMQLSNSWLPKGNTEAFVDTGRALENGHGSLYHLLTTLGKQAGRRLNQPV